MKYIIVPKAYIVACVDAGCPDVAMAIFAEKMELDMNIYFRAIADPSAEENEMK